MFTYVVPPMVQNVAIEGVRNQDKITDYIISWKVSMYVRSYVHIYVHSYIN